MGSVDITRLNILVVEDNVHFRTLIRSILQALGMSKVEEARDGIEALEILGNPVNPKTVDLVILDWKMEGMDGVECVREIRKLDCESRSVPIIMVTGYTETSLQKKARDAGVNDFLGKPISPQSLVGRITSVMDTSYTMVEGGTYYGPERRASDIPIKGPGRRKE